MYTNHQLNMITKFKNRVNKLIKMKAISIIDEGSPLLRQEIVNYINKTDS
jgi:hypothetical protein